jgi:hypothetical protein
LARPIVLIPHLFRLADAINFRKDYSPPSSPPSRPYSVDLGWGLEGEHAGEVSDLRYLAGSTRVSITGNKTDGKRDNEDWG